MSDAQRDRVLALYHHAPRRDRLHVRGRFKSCPVHIIDRAVPPSGRVLEVGCGHGLVAAYLALSSPARRVYGVDIDARKIAVAAHAASHAPAGIVLDFEHRADGSVPEGPYDAIVIADVLYLLDRAAESALLKQCVDQLGDGGVLVLKETDVVPRHKHYLAKVQEFIATRVLRITEGATISFTPVAELVQQLREHDLTVTVERVDRGYLHPHVLITAKR